MLKICYLGHASFKVQNNDFSIIFDPYKNGSVPGLSFPVGEECNYLCVSHEHDDHNGRELVNIVNSQALHTTNFLVPHDKQNGTTRGMSRVFIIELDGVKIAHLGDICDVRNKEWLKPLVGVDIIFCPINGFFTISSKEARQLYEFVQPKTIIPMHYENVSNQSGYPDGGQIDQFKELFPGSKTIDDFEIIIDQSLLQNKAVIFGKVKQ